MTVPEGLAHTIADVLREHAGASFGGYDWWCYCGFRCESAEGHVRHQAEMIAARLGIEQTDHFYGGVKREGNKWEYASLYRVRCLEPDPHTTEER